MHCSLENINFVIGFYKNSDFEVKLTSGSYKLLLYERNIRFLEPRNTEGRWVNDDIIASSPLLILKNKPKMYYIDTISTQMIFSEKLSLNLDKFRPFSTNLDNIRYGSS